MLITLNIEILKNIIENNYCCFHPFTTLEELQLGNHESWHDAYNIYESLINDVHLKFIYKFKKDVRGLENWGTLNYVHVTSHK